MAKKKSLILSLYKDGTKTYCKKQKYDYSTDDDYKEMQILLGKAQGSLDILAGILTPFGGDALVIQREAFIFDGVILELVEEMRTLFQHLDKGYAANEYPGMANLRAKMSALEGWTQERLDQRRSSDKKYRQQSRVEAQERREREREFRHQDLEARKKANQKLLDSF